MELFGCCTDLYAKGFRRSAPSRQKQSTTNYRWQNRNRNLASPQTPSLARLPQADDGLSTDGHGQESAVQCNTNSAIE